MKVYINDNEIEVFQGAKLENALRCYSKKIYREVVRGEKKVIDQYGNQQLLQGSLRPDSAFWIEEAE